MAKLPTLSNMHFIAVTLLSLCSVAAAQVNTAATNLNVSVTAAANGQSVLQCWQMANPFQQNTRYNSPGYVSTSLGGVTNITYAVFPPRSDLGLHTAPYLQWVIAPAGVLHVTLPNTTAGPETEAWFQGGRYGVLFAADTSDVSQYGHGTAFPGDSDTVLLTIPVANNQVPEHTVLYEGPCRWPELVGL